MNEYMFYTFEGFTKSPNGTDCENFQILGFEKAENIEDAKNLLLKNNPWILEYRFDADKILLKKILTKEIISEIKTVVDYLWNDEEKHYEECFSENEKEGNHIFKNLRNLRSVIET